MQGTSVNLTRRLFRSCLFNLCFYSWHTFNLWPRAHPSVSETRNISYRYLHYHTDSCCQHTHCCALRLGRPRISLAKTAIKQCSLLVRHPIFLCSQILLACPLVFGYTWKPNTPYCLSAVLNSLYLRASRLFSPELDGVCFGERGSSVCAFGKEGIPCLPFLPKQICLLLRFPCWGS